MYSDKLFAKETSIKLSVVKIENKKLTKGIFNQLNRKSPFDKLYNLKENVKFLGYVNDKTKCLLWSNKDFIYKYDIKDFFPFLRIDLNKNTIDDLYEVFPSEEVNSLHNFKNENGYYEYQELEISCVLEKNTQYEILEKKETVDKIVEELLKRQIFI
jgi:hypothetical protein